jgi:hypothetical protein
MKKIINERGEHIGDWKGNLIVSKMVVKGYSVGHSFPVPVNLSHFDGKTLGRLIEVDSETVKLVAR